MLTIREEIINLSNKTLNEERNSDKFLREVLFLGPVFGRIFDSASDRRFNKAIQNLNEKIKKASLIKFYSHNRTTLIELKLNVHHIKEDGRIVESILDKLEKDCKEIKSAIDEVELFTKRKRLNSYIDITLPKNIKLHKEDKKKIKKIFKDNIGIKTTFSNSYDWIKYY